MICRAADVAQQLSKGSHALDKTQAEVLHWDIHHVVQYITRPDGQMLIVSYEPMKLVSLE